MQVLLQCPQVYFPSRLSRQVVAQCTILLYLPTWQCVCCKCNRMSTGSHLTRSAWQSQLPSLQLYLTAFCTAFLSFEVRAGSLGTQILECAHPQQVHQHRAALPQQDDFEDVNYEHDDDRAH